MPPGTCISCSGARLPSTFVCATLWARSQCIGIDGGVGLNLLRISLRARLALLAPVAHSEAGLRCAQGAGSRARAPGSGINVLYTLMYFSFPFSSFHSGHMFRIVIFHLEMRACEGLFNRWADWSARLAAVWLVRYG
jgi:hypothetical protein